MVAKVFGKTTRTIRNAELQILHLEDRLTPTFGITELEAIPVIGDRVAAWDDQTVVSGTKPGATNMVAWTTAQRQTKEFQPFEPAFDRGVFVATGDVNGDGQLDVVVSPDEGGGPRVQIRDGKTNAVIADFFGIDDSNFRGGARTAAGDMNNDGYADVAVAAGFGGGPRVTVFDGRALSQGRSEKLIHDFFAFEQALRNGVYVGIGDQNQDGFDDLVIGAGPGGGPRVVTYDGKYIPQGSRFVLSDGFIGDPYNRGGIRVGAGANALVTGPGSAGAVATLETPGRDSTHLNGAITGGFAAFDDEFDIALLGVDLGAGRNGPRYLAYRYKIDGLQTTPVQPTVTPEPEVLPTSTYPEELPPGWLPQGTPGGEAQVPIPDGGFLPPLTGGSGDGGSGIFGNRPQT